MTVRQLCLDLDRLGGFREVFEATTDDERNRVEVHARMERVLVHALEGLTGLGIHLYPTPRDVLVKKYLSDAFRDGSSSKHLNCRRDVLGPLYIEANYGCFDGISPKDVVLG
ncbi:hypothetical protein [Endothiovibrio diazotrophicus]